LKIIGEIGEGIGERGLFGGTRVCGGEEDLGYFAD
jgi:hypothetical protein